MRPVKTIASGSWKTARSRNGALADVCDGWSIAAVVNALAMLFRKQIIGRTAPAIEAEARAAKLTAIAKLLEE
jgi:hypothetical protein